MIHKFSKINLKIVNVSRFCPKLLKFHCIPQAMLVNNLPSVEVGPIR